MVVEGREGVVPRKRGDSVSEIIEDTFRDKSIASSFGGKEELVTEAAIEEVSTREEGSPIKRKGASEVLEDPDSSGGPGPEGGVAAKRQRVVDPDLPATCTVLISPNNGAKVYLVGTAHFSKESCEDVALVIQAVQPDIVMVELCRSRTNILHLDEATILEEAQNLDLEKSLEIIRQQGTVQVGQPLPGPILPWP